jgi:hypothetical protein
LPLKAEKVNVPMRRRRFLTLIMQMRSEAFGAAPVFSENKFVSLNN